MSTVKFTKDHEWILLEEGDVGVIGITDYAQDQLGELVYVELPAVEHDLRRGQRCGRHRVSESGRRSEDAGGRIGRRHQRGSRR